MEGEPGQLNQFDLAVQVSAMQTVAAHGVPGWTSVGCVCGLAHDRFST
jgi:hypothetical protein